MKPTLLAVPLWFLATLACAETPQQILALYQ
jgi:hypothetical protein